MNLVCNKSDTTGATSGAENVYPAPLGELAFSETNVAQSLIFCVMFCRLLFAHFVLFVWQLRYLSFFDLSFLITSLWYE